MIADTQRQAQAAFAKHIPSGFKVRSLKQRESEPVSFDFEVEYPDGAQRSGSAEIDEDGYYVVCVTMEYTPDKGWTYPHRWCHGFVKTCQPA